MSSRRSLKRTSQTRPRDHQRWALLPLARIRHEQAGRRVPFPRGCLMRTTKTTRKCHTSQGNWHHQRRMTSCISTIHRVLLPWALSLTTIKADPGSGQMVKLEVLSVRKVCGRGNVSRMNRYVAHMQIKCLPSCAPTFMMKGEVPSDSTLQAQIPGCCLPVDSCLPSYVMPGSRCMLVLMLLPKFVFQCKEGSYSGVHLRLRCRRHLGLVLGLEFGLETVVSMPKFRSAASSSRPHASCSQVYSRHESCHSRISARSSGFTFLDFLAFPHDARPVRLLDASCFQLDLCLLYCRIILF